MADNQKKPSKGIHYYMRVLHRNIGFLALGMTLVFSLSGTLLVHRGGDFMKATTTVEKTLQPNMTADEVGNALKLKKFKVTEEKDGIICFTDNGKYDSQTGKVTYDKKELVFPFNKFAELHKTESSQNAPRGWFATLFGIVMAFLAISSLLMFPTKTKQFKANMIYAGIGIIITLILLLI